MIEGFLPVRSCQVTDQGWIEGCPRPVQPREGTRTLSGSTLAPRSLIGSFSFLRFSFTETLMVMSVSPVTLLVL